MKQQGMGHDNPAWQMGLEDFCLPVDRIKPLTRNLCFGLVVNACPLLACLPSQAISAMEERLQEGSELPVDLRCPITYQLLRDPVILVDSHQTYERSAIQEWLDRGNRKDPITGGGSQQYMRWR